ncbi:hypothetical protein SOVF_126960 [Spinacia oleracea]|uniref:Trypsin inhibitor domain-containing protein n=1 Tax=Spinacia oleracea TaxID=3562 RepID=A0A9R0I2D9_SPIOL|nr:uncharacterized protein LOC110781465 [Spinacia oleracea]KNA12326.1 hypothetical protein SOVF_126960 [Spinacia oleracea]
MLGPLKLAILAFLMLTASVDAKLLPRSTTKITKEELSAEIEAMMEFKEVENNSVNSIFGNEKNNVKLYRKLMQSQDSECSPSGRVCSGGGPPQQCCSGACVPHPRLKVFVCA